MPRVTANASDGIDASGYTSFEVLCGVDFMLRAFMDIT